MYYYKKIHTVTYIIIHAPPASCINQMSSYTWQRGLDFKFNQSEFSSYDKALDWKYSISADEALIFQSRLTWQIH